MNADEFRKRTKYFAIRIGHFCRTLPHDTIARHYISQLVRCSSSVGANYRAACRAKSKPDFIYKLRIVEEEADESLFWLELLAEFHPDRKKEIGEIYREANELLSMIVRSINTATQKNLGTEKS
ncbi:MAG: hypothetical protein JWP27_792 [Flaviaesturariibacter sp.]|nr:hypothetical protein [Flaviaesturariibacter sp.]